MRCLPLLGILCHFLIATHAQLDVPGVRVSRSSLLRTFTPGSCSDGTAKTSVCSSCSSLSICFGGNAIAEVPCSGSNSFCNPGNVEASCSATPVADCVTPGVTPQVSPITCPALGVLPDPTNCNVYHVCRTVLQSSDVYRCPPGYHFNLTTQLCRSDQVDQCVRVQCGTTSGIVYYGTSRQYYAVCVVANGATTPLIMKCPDRASFSMTAFNCVYQCPGQGNFENSNDPSMFYQCYIANGNSVAALQRCPTGTTFKGSLQYCT